MYINEITREESEKILKDIYEKENDRSIYRMKNRLTYDINETDKLATGFYHYTEHILPGQLDYDRIKFFHFQGVSAFGGKEDIVCVIGSIDDPDDENSDLYIINLYGNKKSVLDFNNCFKFEINKCALRIFGYETILLGNEEEKKEQHEDYYKAQFTIDMDNISDELMLADSIKGIEFKIIDHLKVYSRYDKYAFNVYIKENDAIVTSYLIRIRNKYIALFKPNPSLAKSDILNVYKADIENIENCGVMRFDFDSNDLNNDGTLIAVLNKIFSNSLNYLTKNIINTEKLIGSRSILWEVLADYISSRFEGQKDYIYNFIYTPGKSGCVKYRIIIRIDHIENHKSRYIVFVTNISSHKKQKEAYYRDNYHFFYDYVDVLKYLSKELQ